MNLSVQDQLADTGPLATLEELAADLVEQVGDDICQYQRYNENLVVLSYTGRWAVYTLSASVTRNDQLVMSCIFEVTWAEERLLELHRTVNLISSTVIGAHLVLAEPENRVILRTWTDLDQKGLVDPERISKMIDLSIDTCEQYYPTFLAIGWDHEYPTAESAFALGIETGYGTA